MTTGENAIACSSDKQNSKGAFAALDEPSFFDHFPAITTALDETSLL
jgi:hypothetical protein